VLSRRVLNRTLLLRQGLLAREHVPPLAMVEHLLGLQAQEPLSPYVSLWSRIASFDPHQVSAALEERTAVRLLLMRGTIHLVTASDALLLRPLLQPMLDRLTRSSQSSRPAAHLDGATLAAAVRDALRERPLSIREPGERLASSYPDVPAGALASTARELVPLVQVPPRGLWKQAGGVVHATVGSWLGKEPESSPEPATMADMVRRYLRAYGPATPADLAVWSGLTGVRPVFEGMREELATHCDEDGTELFDMHGATLADADTPAPVRLLGRYDNVWLAHQRRDRVTPDPSKRRRWMGSNGGVAATLFVDGELEGLWRTTASGAVEVELFSRLTRAERADLDAEVAALEQFLRS
jgi:hypothetical protein